MGVPFLVVPTIVTIVFWGGLYWGTLILGNYLIGITSHVIVSNSKELFNCSLCYRSKETTGSGAAH